MLLNKFRTVDSLSNVLIYPSNLPHHTNLWGEAYNGKKGRGFIVIAKMSPNTDKVDNYFLFR